MYTDNQLHPKHKFVIAQMALDRISTSTIEFYRRVRFLLEYGSTCIELSENYGVTRRQAHRLINDLIAKNYIHKDGSKYYINKQCVTDKHLVAGMNALGYI